MEKKNTQKVSIKFCNDVWAGDMVNKWYGCIGAIGVFRSCRRERFPAWGAICLACFLLGEWFVFSAPQPVEQFVLLVFGLWSDSFFHSTAWGAICFCLFLFAPQLGNNCSPSRGIKFCVWLMLICKLLIFNEFTSEKQIAPDVSFLWSWTCLKIFFLFLSGLFWHALSWRYVPASGVTSG